MTETVQLSRAYHCKGGGPVLRAVERRIFALRYFQPCMDCRHCGDSCCDFGVDIDLQNVARLKALPADFKALIAVPEEQWFAGEITWDKEFPGGAHVRTAAIDGACVFRNRKGRGCLIHAYALQTKRDYHDFKPLVSTLFPVTFEQGVLVAAGELADGSLRCAGDGPSLYQGARDELLYYFGDGLIAELDGLAR
ncbi:MAG: hypothetical protein JO256_07325 [Alphaproteobacteria bacterium]|nr:hypothetical protein [Alphaproteobacteria bacterium]